MKHQCVLRKSKGRLKLQSTKTKEAAKSMLPLRSDSPSTASLYASPFVAIDSILLLFALLNNTQLLVTLLGWRLNNKDAINGGAICSLCWR